MGRSVSLDQLPFEYTPPPFLPFWPWLLSLDVGDLKSALSSSEREFEVAWPFVDDVSDRASRALCELAKVLANREAPLPPEVGRPPLACCCPAGVASWPLDCQGEVAFEPFPLAEEGPLVLPPPQMDEAEPRD